MEVFHHSNSSFCIPFFVTYSSDSLFLAIYYYYFFLGNEALSFDPTVHGICPKPFKNTTQAKMFRFNLLICLVKFELPGCISAAMFFTHFQMCGLTITASIFYSWTEQSEGNCLNPRCTNRVSKGKL